MSIANFYLQPTFASFNLDSFFIAGLEFSFSLSPKISNLFYLKTRSSAIKNRPFAFP